MKKLYSLLLIFMLFSSLLVFAHHENVDRIEKVRERVNDESDDSEERVDRDVRIEKILDGVNASGDRRVAAIDKLRDRIRRDAAKTIDRLKLRNVQIEHRIVKREEAIEIRERLKECITEGDLEECKELRKETKLRIKHSLQRTTNRVLNVLTKLKERVENSDFENKDTALEEINT